MTGTSDPTGDPQPDEAGEAPTGPSPTGSRMPSASAALMIALFFVVGLAALVFRLSGGGMLSASEIDLSVPDWRPTAEEVKALDAVARARRAVDPKDGPQVSALLTSYEAFNRADLRYGSDPRAAALADAKAEYEQRALTSLGFLGKEAYMGLGERVARQYLAALERGDKDILDRLGGTFLTQARLTSLVGGERVIRQGSERMIPILFRSRWAYAVSARARPDTLLSYEEALVLLRWKLAANPLVPPERRQQIAAELRALGSVYPVRRAMAARAADEGNWAAAARLYSDLANERPDDRAAWATALYARSRAEASPK
jgi:hypothetical protein